AGFAKHRGGHTNHTFNGERWLSRHEHDSIFFICRRHRVAHYTKPDHAVWRRKGKFNLLDAFSRYLFIVRADFGAGTDAAYYRNDMTSRWLRKHIIAKKNGLR